MTGVDVRHVCDSWHSVPQVPIVMILVMCLPARLAESCRRIKQSPCLQAAADVRVTLLRSSLPGKGPPYLDKTFASLVVGGAAGAVLWKFYHSTMRGPRRGSAPALNIDMASDLSGTYPKHF